MNLSIIEADVSYAAAIARIGKKSFRHAFGHLFNSQTELFGYLEYSYNPVKLTKSIKKGNNVYFIALMDGQAIGFAKVKINSLNEKIESIAQMELQKIYVLPEFQGMDAGAALMNEIKNLAAYTGPDCIWLDTHISNQTAIRFYEKSGFKKLGKQFFTVGSQTFEYYIMELPLALEVTKEY